MCCQDQDGHQECVGNVQVDLLKGLIDYADRLSLVRKEQVVCSGRNFLPAVLVCMMKTCCEHEGIESDRILRDPD